MKVKQLKINSFRGIKDLTLDFDLSEPTVLIGVNGSGKSSILDCLATILSWTNNIFQEIAQYLDDPYNELNMQTVDASDFCDLDINNQAKKTSSTLIVSDNHTKNYPLTLERIKNDWKKSATKPSIKGEFTPASLQQIRTIGFLPIAVHYSAQRNISDTPLGAKNNVFALVNAYSLALDNKNIDFKDFFEWFRNREDLENENYKRNPDKEKDRQLEAVRQAIYQILEGFSNLRIERFPLQMTLEKNGQRLIINQLSDGEKSLLAMVGDLARRLAMLSDPGKDPLQGQAIVLIDQIELHLHPKWQREIIAALKRTFPNCQFIITTHSPQVISNIQPENIYLLESSEEGIIARHPQTSFGRDSNSILEDVMGVSERPLEIKQDLLKLFQIIDEGNLEAAQKLRQEIADKIGSDEPELIKAATSIKRKEILNR